MLLIYSVFYVSCEVEMIAYFCEEIEHHCMDAGLLNALDGAVASEGREVNNNFHICTDIPQNPQ